MLTRAEKFERLLLLVAIIILILDLFYWRGG